VSNGGRALRGREAIEHYLSARYRGEGGHECRPAGRGQTESRWECPDCGARWKRTEGGAIIRTLTWERADLR
jgi:hypothetical protein